MPRRLREDPSFPPIKIDRPYAVFVHEADDLPGIWVAHIVGHGLDNVTQGDGPEGALEMAADLLRGLTDRCKDPDGHDYSIETVVLTCDANGVEEWVPGWKCAHCEFSAPKTNGFEIF